MATEDADVLLTIQLLATVSITEAVGDLPITSGCTAWGLPYASRDTTLTAIGWAGIAAATEAVNTLIDAHGREGLTVRRKGDRATPFASFVPPAANVRVPCTPSRYDPLVVAM